MLPRENCLRFMSFDPGSRFFGWAVFDRDVVNNKTYLITAGTLVRSTFLNAGVKDLMEVNGESTVGWQLMGEEISELLSLYQPKAIAYERAHFKRKMVNTFKSLTTGAAIIKLLAYQMDPSIPIMDISPNDGKKAVGSKQGSGDKDLVANALKDFDGFEWADDSLVEELSEHAVDAVAIGVAFSNVFFEGE